MRYEGWYRLNRSRLSGAGIWLRGGELNTLPLSEWEARDFRVLFARLSTYDDTGYSFTHQLLYQLASKLPKVFPDLAFLPPRKDLPVFDESGVPYLLGTQSKRGAREFDLLGISNSIVQELLNLPLLLEKSGISLSKAKRMQEPGPLVILGGANALYSSSLWEEDPLVDGIFVGESDQGIRKIIEIAQSGKRQGLSKPEILLQMEAVPGFFQPDRPRATRKGFIWSLAQSEALEAGPVYYLEDQLGKGHLQISEGCPCFCSFCAESWDRKPYRERRSANLKDMAMKMKAAMGLDTIELYSFNFNMHSDFYQILWDLVPHFRKVGLKSQRFDLLAHDPEMIEFQHAIEKASITCGLEGISPRLRRYLHKNLENPELHKSLEAIFKSKARELKVFLIATGLEETQDLDALEDLMNHVKSIRRRVDRSTRVIFSMTPLVRFPWTPLEFEDGFPMEHYGRIIKETAARVTRAGFEFRESADLPEYWVSQVMVRAAHPGVRRAWRSAVASTNFIYYREINHTFQRALASALAKEGLSEHEVLKGHTLEESRNKPWAQIQTGVSRDFLWEEVKRAREYKEIDYCLGRSWQESKCFLCEGCPSPDHILDIVKAKQERNYSLGAFKERIRRSRESERTVSFLVKIGEQGQGVPRKMVGVALARALMLAVPALAPSYRGFRQSYWSHDEKPCWVRGDDVLELYFGEEGEKILASVRADRAVTTVINGHLGHWGELRQFSPSAWKPAGLEFHLPETPLLERYFKEKGLKYTLKRLEGLRYTYELTDSSRRKGFITGLTHDKGQNIVRLIPEAKFSPEEFFRAVLPANAVASGDCISLS